MAEINIIKLGTFHVVNLSLDLKIDDRLKTKKKGVPGK